MHSRTLVMILALTLPGAALGQSTESNVTSFQLYNGCQPFQLLVEYDLYEENSDEHNQAIDLTKQAIQNLAESRLRAARLHTKTASPQYLDIDIRVVGISFHISLSFMKVVYDTASDSRGYASTWGAGYIGIANNSGFILSNLSERMDLFLVEYLRVNEDACG